MSPAPRPGDVYALTEPDYKFGAGPLLCRVRTVLARVYFDGRPWWHLRGECAPGVPSNHGGWFVRELYVAEAVLAARRRVRGRQPEQS